MKIYFFMKHALNSTATLSDQVADISNTKVRPRTLGPCRIRKVTGITVEVDLRSGTKNVSMDSLVLVTWVPESLPSPQRRLP